MSATRSIVIQIVALVLVVPALACGVVVVWSTAFPPICGDASGVVGLGLAACWLVDLPCGALALAIGLRVRSGAARLRQLCIAIATITLCLPIIATALFQRLHCP